MLGHTQTLLEASKALHNTDVQSLNAIAKKIGAQLGDSAPTIYNTIVNRLGPEITKAYIQSGAGTLEDRKANKVDFDIALGPKQLEGNARATMILAASKIKANQDQYNRGTYGRGKQKLITDENEAFLKNMGIDPGKPLEGMLNQSKSTTVPDNLKPKTKGQKLDPSLIPLFYNLAGKDPAKAKELAQGVGWDTSAGK
jgi:hypothetical protein